MTLCFYVACIHPSVYFKIFLNYLQCVIQDKHYIGSRNTVLFRDWRQEKGVSSHIQSAEPTNVETPASGHQMCNSPS